MKIKTVLFLPQLSFVLSFFANASETDHKGGVAIEARQGRLPEKTLTKNFINLKHVVTHQSSNIPSLSQGLTNQDPALPLKKIECNDLRHLFETQIGEQGQNNLNICFQKVEIQGRMVQLTHMNTKAAVEQIRELLQDPTATALLATINPQTMGLKKPKPPSTATYQLYRDGRIAPEYKPFQVSFRSKPR